MITAVLLAVTTVSVSQSRAEFVQIQGQRMLAIAENMASTPLIRDDIAAPEADVVLAPDVEKARTLSGASIAAVTDSSGKVLASSDPQAVGDRLDLAQSRAPLGRSWTGNLTLSGRRTIGARVPILQADGTVSGVVVVAEDYPPLGGSLAAAVPDLMIFLGMGAVLGVLGSWLLSRLIRRRTRGLEPREIADLADNREALLYSIREGVIGVGIDGRVTLLNKTAIELLGLPSNVAGERVDELPLSAEVKELLLDTSDGEETAAVTGSRLLVLNRRVVGSRGRPIGTVTTLRDRTEMAELESRLAANQSITETMRAQTHEFFNQLHTVSGLVQLGEFEEVRSFIGTLTRRRAEINDDISSRIEDAAVSALLVAKTSLAAESGIELRLSESSALGPLEPSLAADTITVLGNFIDNAVDATAGLSGVIVLVDLGDNDSMITIRVSDPGPGVPEDLEHRIFNRGFTTKPVPASGRGIGLALVRLVCARRQGSVGVHNLDGAVFEATLPYPAPVR
ncbi:sensor histidine kinase [Arthrobacter sp. H14-L1]|uniref:sensor histidine kinase n=1 Tax=Arthrobacter sp. H14-L1 TaxID=2996697 RepID=UPI00226E8D01|nr:ATP-binding protein [Arthrobacter sp. H14-L1]MCY0904416.1 ATP-binding protein [Arthrobacter sp. H14-L1]